MDEQIDVKIDAEKVMEMMEIQCETDTEFDLKIIFLYIFQN